MTTEVTPAVPAKTATVTPAATPTITSVISKDWSWFVSHLVSLIVCGVLVVAGIYGVEKIVADHDLANSNKYTQILNTQAAQTAAIQKQQQTDEAHFAVIESALLAQNAQLTKQITTRNQTAAVQVKQDASLSAQDSAARLLVQTHASAGEVTTQGDNVTLDLPISRTVVASLDQLSAVQSDLADTQHQLANETTIATNDQTEIDDQKKEIAALEQQIADLNKAHAAEVKSLKADARKGRLKWFGIGFVTGFISGATAHLW